MNMQIYTIGIGEKLHVETIEQFSTNVNMLFMQVPPRLLMTDYEQVWNMCIGPVDLGHEQGLELLTQLAELRMDHQFSATIRDWLTSVYNAVKHELMKTDAVYGSNIGISKDFDRAIKGLKGAVVTPQLLGV